MGLGHSADNTYINKALANITPYTLPTICMMKVKRNQSHKEQIANGRNNKKGCNNVSCRNESSKHLGTDDDKVHLGNKLFLIPQSCIKVCVQILLLNNVKNIINLFDWQLL